MKIYFARHGDYENGADDFTRGLNERGRREIAAMAGALKDRGVAIKKTVHSGKLRAQQTAEILADALMPASVLGVVEGLYPNDDPVVIESEHLTSQPSETLIVGHLPFMGRMISLLLTGNPDEKPEAFSTGTVVCMEQSDDGKWKKQWVMHTADLANL